TLVLRNDLSGNPRFVELLEASKQTILDAYAHQHVPFEMLVEELKPERSLRHSPLFQILFTLQNTEQADTGLGGSRLEWGGEGGGVVRFDLELTVRELDAGLALSWWYKQELFLASTIERLASSFGVLLEGILAGPEAGVQSLPLLLAAQRHQIAVEWNATGSAYPREATLGALFAQQAAETPERTAWEYEREKLSYGELDRRSNQVARFLIHQGVKPGDLVGVLMARSAVLVEAMLGIVKMGAAYVPLDPAYPAERLALMLADSGSVLLLTEARLEASLPEPATKAVRLDAAWGESDAGVEAGGSAEDLAYVIYTSGSTGRPKGVAVPQRAVVRLVRNSDYVRLSRADRVAQLANLSFDAATFEIWGALLNGATLVGVSQDVVLSPRDLAAFLQEQEISVLFLTTALFNQVAQQAPEGFGRVRDLLFGGEAVDPGAVRRVLRAGPPARLLHVYGPTENTTFSSWFVVTEVAEGAVTVPIGRPIANSRAYVLDAGLEPVPLGVVGELYLGGDGLACEYLNAPELTQEKFVESPGLPGERLYRTGDLVRLLADGNLEFRGRDDQQVKLRGFRIEPVEIELALVECAGVSEAAVVLREDLPAGRGLVAYAVAKPGVRLSGAALRESLKTTLPDYMLPAYVTVLDALPLTPNGKVDRAALPAPEAGYARDEYVAPRTELERLLCAIWEEVLGVERVG
ncbi:MAG: amino acid adenylation domain-containing protein, partial [Acidobacteria bacterium]|nr:amino acid adenylation domain-containing protein [Acidobacteriota bacterium]